MTDAPTPPTGEAFDDPGEYLLRIWGHAQGFMVAGMIGVGQRLGLYEAMRDAGPITSEELATKAGLSERWVREWLHGQAAAGVLRHDRGDAGQERFELPAVAVDVLADRSALTYASTFEWLPTRADAFRALPESFRTGIGRPWDSGGAEGAAGTAASFANWYRHLLVPVMLPALDGVSDRLRAGAKVADVGCGAGSALLVLADAFGAADLHGYEASTHALELAAAARDRAGATNVTFHHVEDEPLPEDESFDLIMTLDCIHDMTDPAGVIGAIARSLRPDGVWLWAEIRARDTFEENLENPMAAMMYGYSLTSCLSSALSEEGGAGYGTLGITQTEARRLAAEAGFGSFEVHDFGNPTNLYYEVRR